MNEIAEISGQENAPVVLALLVAVFLALALVYVARSKPDKNDENMGELIKLMGGTMERIATTLNRTVAMVAQQGDLIKTLSDGAAKSDLEVRGKLLFHEETAKERFEKTLEKLDETDKRLEGVANCLAMIPQSLQQIQNRVAGVEGRMATADRLAAFEKAVMEAVKAADNTEEIGQIRDSLARMEKVLGEISPSPALPKHGEGVEPAGGESPVDTISPSPALPKHGEGAHTGAPLQDGSDDPKGK